MSRYESYQKYDIGLEIGFNYLNGNDGYFYHDYRGDDDNAKTKYLIMIPLLISAHYRNDYYRQVTISPLLSIGLTYLFEKYDFEYNDNEKYNGIKPYMH